MYVHPVLVGFGFVAIVVLVALALYAISELLK